MTYSTQKQPNPIPNHSEPIAHLVIDDLRLFGAEYLIPEVEARMRQGLATYGIPLQANNGRDALVDAFQESIDLMKYLKQCIAEGDDRLKNAYLSSIALASQIYAEISLLD